MRGLRYAALLALTVWIGGLVALGSIAAPSIFDVTAARGVADGRAVAGAIFGEILRRFHHLAYLSAAILILSLVTRRILGPRPHRLGIRVLLASIMLAATLYSGSVISSRIAALQQQIGAAPSSLPEHDPRRAEFGKLHGMSNALHLIPLLGGLVLIWFELRD
jgi:uncharacterized membrane protein